MIRNVNMSHDISPSSPSLGPVSDVSLVQAPNEVVSLAISINGQRQQVSLTRREKVLLASAPARRRRGKRKAGVVESEAGGINYESRRRIPDPFLAESEESHESKRSVKSDLPSLGMAEAGDATAKDREVSDDDGFNASQRPRPGINFAYINGEYYLIESTNPKRHADGSNYLEANTSPTVMSPSPSHTALQSLANTKSPTPPAPVRSLTPPVISLPSVSAPSISAPASSAPPATSSHRPPRLWQPPQSWSVLTEKNGGPPPTPPLRPPLGLHFPGLGDESPRPGTTMSTSAQGSKENLISVSKSVSVSRPSKDKSKLRDAIPDPAGEGSDFPMFQAGFRCLASSCEGVFLDENEVDSHLRSAHGFGSDNHNHGLARGSGGSSGFGIASSLGPGSGEEGQASRKTSGSARRGDDGGGARSSFEITSPSSEIAGIWSSRERDEDEVWMKALGISHGIERELAMSMSEGGAGHPRAW